MPVPFSSNSALEPTYGAHPTIVTTVHLPELDSNSTCSLLIHYSLPPLLFVDIYELEMRKEEYDVVGLRGRGAKELERPVHALPALEDLDSSVGVELVLRKDVQRADIQVRLPIHVRYGEPIASDASTPYTIQGLSPPSLVLTCLGAVPSCNNNNSDVPHYLQSFLSTEPFCVAESHASQPLEIPVPLGNTADLPIVEFGTSAVILVCFAWIALEAWRTSSRLWRAEKNPKND